MKTSYFPKFALLGIALLLLPSCSQVEITGRKQFNLVFVSNLVRGTKKRKK